MMEFTVDMALRREVQMVSDYWSSVMQWNWLWQTRVSRGGIIHWSPMYLVAQWVHWLLVTQEMWWTN